MRNIKILSMICIIIGNVLLGGCSFYKNTKGKDISKVKFVSIGPMTSKTLYKYGYKVDIEAKVYSLEGILDEVIKEVKNDKK